MLTCVLDHEHQLFRCDHEMMDVTEAIGTGLAIKRATNFSMPVSPLASEDAYNLVHVYSGLTLVSDTTPSIVYAAMWLRKIVPFCSWTLPAEQLRKLDLPHRVRSALIEIIDE